MLLLTPQTLWCMTYLVFGVVVVVVVLGVMYIHYHTLYRLTLNSLYIRVHSYIVCGILTHKPHVHIFECSPYEIMLGISFKFSSSYP